MVGYFGPIDDVEVAPFVLSVTVGAGLGETGVQPVAPGASRKSDFFRDLAASRYLPLADAACRERELSFERMAGLFASLDEVNDEVVKIQWLFGERFGK